MIDVQPLHQSIGPEPAPPRRGGAPAGVRPAILKGWLYVPTGAVRGGPDGLATMKAFLTHKPKFADAEHPPIALYDEQFRGYIGVPRAFGRQHFGRYPVDDRRSLGYPITVPVRPDPNHPRVRDPAAQAKFMADLHREILAREGLLAMAGTGTGKTVSFLDATAAIGRTTLILLHKQRLLEQWMDEIHAKLGIPMDQIGVIQQDRCDFEGKPISVGMLHSIARRGIGGSGYPETLRKYFGVIGCDEVHKMGTGQFAHVLPMFDAFYWAGLTATPEREDGGDKVFLWHIGPIAVTSTADPLPCDVYAVDFDSGNHPLWGDDPFSRVSCLMRIPARNRAMVAMVKRFHAAGRQALIVGENVLHLQHLMELCEAAGVPRECMGQFTGDRQTVEWIDDPETGKRTRKVRKRKMTKAHLDKVKAESQIIFATYGMMTEGVDIPRLDAGMDVTPRGKATQLIGRIRRPVPGKKKPLWITHRDVRCSISKGMFFGRCKDYGRSGAELYVNGRKHNLIPAPRTHEEQACGH